MLLPRAASFHSLLSFASSRISFPSSLESPSLSRNTSRTHTSSIDTTSSDHGPERALPCNSPTSHSTCSVSQSSPYRGTVSEHPHSQRRVIEQVHSRC